MVDYSSAKLDRIFHALSDQTRRSMLAQLAKGDSNVTDLARPYDQSLAGISKHLKVLENAELVKKAKSGRVITCRVNLEPLANAWEVLEQLGVFWRERLDSLEEFLNEGSKKKERSHGTSKGNRKKTRSCR